MDRNWNVLINCFFLLKEKNRVNAIFLLNFHTDYFQRKSVFYGQMYLSQLRIEKIYDRENILE